MQEYKYQKIIGGGRSGALFGEPDYRLTLWRRWSWNVAPVDMCVFIGLNPSTADEHKDDPTIRRCKGFAKDWGFQGLVMINIFSFRATKPSDMKAQEDPIGKMNDEVLKTLAVRCGRTVCCWGNHGGYRKRSNEVLAMLAPLMLQVQPIPRSLWHLGLTVKKEPRHPLYLRSDTDPVRWELNT